MATGTKFMKLSVGKELEHKNMTNKWINSFLKETKCYSWDEQWNNHTVRKLIRPTHLLSVLCVLNVGSVAGGVEEMCQKWMIFIIVFLLTSLSTQETLVKWWIQGNRHSIG